MIKEMGMTYMEVADENIERLVQEMRELDKKYLEKQKELRKWKKRKDILLNS